MKTELKRRRSPTLTTRTSLKDQIRPSRRRRAEKVEPPEGTSAPPPIITKSPSGKLGTLVALMSREAGATMEELVQATGWQAHSIRGAMAGALKRNRGYEIGSTKAEGVRTYRIAGRKEAEAG